MSINPNPDRDFDGCRRTCRQKGAHTRVWGECEHGVEPEPTVSLSRRYTDTDGFPSIGFDSYTVTQLGELITAGLRASDLPVNGDDLVDIGVVAARAIVHRNDGPVSAAVSVVPPATNQTAALAEDLRYVLGHNEPGHAHEEPGVWDTSGEPCGHCARLAVARQNLAAYDGEAEAGQAGEDRPETPLEKRLRYSERRNDELRAECKRRGKTVLEYAEKIVALERQLDEVRGQLGAEILRAGQAEAELRRLAADEAQPTKPDRCPHGCDTSTCPCLACEAAEAPHAETPDAPAVVAQPGKETAS